MLTIPLAASFTQHYHLTTSPGLMLLSIGDSVWVEHLEFTCSVPSSQKQTLQSWTANGSQSPTSLCLATSSQLSIERGLSAQSTTLGLTPVFLLQAGAALGLEPYHWAPRLWSSVTPSAGPCQHHRLISSPIIMELEGPEWKRMHSREISSPLGLPQMIQLGNFALFQGTESHGLNIQGTSPAPHQPLRGLEESSQFFTSNVWKRITPTPPEKDVTEAPAPEGLPSTKQAPRAVLQVAHIPRPKFSSRTPEGLGPLCWSFPAFLLTVDVSFWLKTRLSATAHFLHLCILPATFSSSPPGTPSTGCSPRGHPVITDRNAQLC